MDSVSQRKRKNYLKRPIFYFKYFFVFFFFFLRIINKSSFANIFPKTLTSRGFKKSQGSLQNIFSKIYKIYFVKIVIFFLSARFERVVGKIFWKNTGLDMSDKFLGVEVDQKLTNFLILLLHCRSHLKTIRYGISREITV